MVEVPKKIPLNPLDFKDYDVFVSNLEQLERRNLIGNNPCHRDLENGACVGQWITRILCGYTEGDLTNWKSGCIHNIDEGVMVYISYEMAMGLLVRLILSDEDGESYNIQYPCEKGTVLNANTRLLEVFSRAVTDIMFGTGLRDTDGSRERAAGRPLSMKWKDLNYDQKDIWKRKRVFGERHELDHIREKHFKTFYKCARKVYKILVKHGAHDNPFGTEDWEIPASVVFKRAKEDFRELRDFVLDRHA